MNYKNKIRYFKECVKIKQGELLYKSFEKRFLDRNNFRYSLSRNNSSINLAEIPFLIMLYDVTLESFLLGVKSSK